ncbi:MAG: hypothetical protein ACMG6E_09240 [Candidatus Roizmanbacteria bacterium]
MRECKRDECVTCPILKDSRESEGSMKAMNVPFSNATAFCWDTGLILDAYMLFLGGEEWSEDASRAFWGF